MFCKNCGQELSSNAKFCPGCGTAIEEDKLEIQSAVPEKGADNSSSLESAENNVTDIDSSAENKSDEAEKDTVQAQPIESYSEPEQNDNEVIESANESKQSEIAKSDFPATDNIKEVLLPQKGKNGKVKFKDLPKKQKIIRIAIGGGLLLIALIWMISDGISGANKARDTSVNSEKSKTVDVIPYQCDTGALLDMTLAEFSDAFSKSVSNYYDTEFNLYEIWNLTTGTEDSGVAYQLYSAKPIADTYIYVKTIDNHIGGIIVSLDYSSETYRENMSAIGEVFGHSVIAIGNMNADEEEKMRTNLCEECDASKERTSYICNNIKYTIIPDKLNPPINNTIVGFTFLIDPVSKEYVNSLDDNIIYNDFGDVNPDTEGAFGSEPPNKAEDQYNVKDQDMKNLVLYRLYQETAYPSGMEDAVRMGVYDDISLGDVIDYIFESPDFSVDQDGENYFVTISGRYRYSVGSDYVYTGSITYRISESGYVSVSSDPNNITGIIQSIAISMGHNY